MWNVDLNVVHISIIQRATHLTVWRFSAKRKVTAVTFVNRVRVGKVLEENSRRGCRAAGRLRRKLFRKDIWSENTDKQRVTDLHRAAGQPITEQEGGGYTHVLLCVLVCFTWELSSPLNCSGQDVRNEAGTRRKPHLTEITRLSSLKAVGAQTTFCFVSKNCSCYIRWHPEKTENTKSSRLKQETVLMWKGVPSELWLDSLSAVMMTRLPVKK